MTRRSRMPSRRFALMAGITGTVVVVAIAAGVYALARADVRRTAGWIEDAPLRFARCRPSLTHGLWIEFEATDPGGVDPRSKLEVYWYAYPWRSVKWQPSLLKGTHG